MLLPLLGFSLLFFGGRDNKSVDFYSAYGDMKSAITAIDSAEKYGVTEHVARKYKRQSENFLKKYLFWCFVFRLQCCSYIVRGKIFPSPNSSFLNFDN